MNQSHFREYKDEIREEHLKKKQDLVRDLDLYYFFGNILYCFKKQFPEYIDAIEMMEKELPTTNFQVWFDACIEPYVIFTGTTLEDAYQAVTKRFIEGAYKKDIPRYYGYHVHKDVTVMEIYGLRDTQTRLMDASFPLDYTLVEGLALMVHNIYYDTPGAGVYFTSFTGK